MREELEIKKDERGDLIEIFKIPGFGQVYYVTAKPGIVRGNHYHSRKKEKFCVIEGSAKITLKNRETDEVITFSVSEKKPEVINIPPNWSHNIENTGENDMKLLAWANETYDPNDPDTYSEKI
jgi:UDP-2-acetamido-2,6-beta-L-arabino-hexul-4-ose reductase